MKETFILIGPICMVCTYSLVTSSLSIRSSSGPPSFALEEAEPDAEAEGGPLGKVGDRVERAVGLRERGAVKEN